MVYDHQNVPHEVSGQSGKEYFVTICGCCCTSHLKHVGFVSATYALSKCYFSGRIQNLFLHNADKWRPWFHSSKRERIIMDPPSQQWAPNQCQKSALANYFPPFFSHQVSPTFTLHTSQFPFPCLAPLAVINFSFLLFRDEIEWRLARRISDLAPVYSPIVHYLDR